MRKIYQAVAAGNLVGINASQFRSCVIDPALAAMMTCGIPVSKTAADLLMATAAVETLLGHYLRQLGGGPARSVFQIEPATLANAIQDATPSQVATLQDLTVVSIAKAIDEIDTNLVLAAACARLIYWQVPAPLPPDTAVGLFTYWKQWYNTPAGKGTEDEFMAALKLTDIVFAYGVAERTTARGAETTSAS